MEQSPRLSLSYLAPSQSQKHVTVNETFRRLDQLVAQSALSRTTSAQPGAPADGDAYILPAGPTGADWSTFAQHSIAAWQDGAWTEIVPQEGWRIWVADADEFLVFDGSAWQSLGEGFGLTKLGINTTADTTNRLAVKSDAILFNYDDVTPGNDDCQVKINKKTAADTASLLFQTGASGRAEFGLAGDDDFHIKVSPDGFTTTFEALVVDKDTGFIGVGTSAPGQRLHLAESAADVRCLFDTYSANAAHGGRSDFRRSLTDTVGAHAATGNGQNLGNFAWLGDSGSAFTNGAFFGGIQEGAAGTFTPTAIRFSTSDGTSNWTERCRISADGGIVVGAPTGASKGAGTVNAQAVYDDNTLLTCYVFDQALDGAVDLQKWDAKVPDRAVGEERDLEGVIVRAPQTIARAHEPLRKFAARIGTVHDPLTLDGYARHWREKRHLTAMPNEAAFDPVAGALTTGEWVQRLVETVEIQAVLIEMLNARMKALETAAAAAAGRP